jgi:enoyl-CoA hydratase/carnithine racemase
VTEVSQVSQVSSQNVMTARHGRVATITLDRPQARNALNRALLTELLDALDVLGGDPGVGVVVLTGADPAFCAGADLREGSAQQSDDFWAVHERASQSMRLHQKLARLPKPVVAAVNGPAVAGGCGLAMSCDIVIASDRAAFGYPEVRRGLVAAMAMVSLSRIVGQRVALDLLLTGRTVAADEALAIGLINRVVPHADLIPAVLEYATDMAARSSSALRLTKELFRQVPELDYDRALEHARDVNLLVRQTTDAHRGYTDFATRKEAPH